MSKTFRFMGALAPILAISTFFIIHHARAEGWGEIPKLQEFIYRQDVVTNAYAIEALGLNESSLPQDSLPWSDTYWPDVKGSIAYPYAESHLIPSINFLLWGPNRPYIANRGPYRAGLATASQAAIDALAPAEKYDLLMGDPGFTLTNRVVAMIDALSAAGLTSYWSGVCHGWSPASLTLPRPKHPFALGAPNGRSITFYPSDVKALASFLWGKSLAQGSTKVEGWQCQSGARANKYGRLVDPRCFDVNPGFFHLVMANQIGINKRGFVMDRNYRAEVQNQPVYAYRLRYYRVSDRHPNFVRTVRDAVLPRAGLRWDPFKSFRDPRGVSLVGVEVTVWYAKERDPLHASIDGPEYDKHEDFTIRYDLELDAQGDIVGGEWRESDAAAAPTLVEQIAYQHPDLIWVVPPELRAYSIADADIGGVEWDGSGTVPDAWRQAAIKAAQFEDVQRAKSGPVTIPRPQPLGKVVDLLIKKSRE
jgi:hypothetical protein